MKRLAGSRLRAMITKSWQWARDNSRFRVNPVHGEEEIYITIHDGFEMKITESEEMVKSGSLQVQDCSGDPRMI